MKNLTKENIVKVNEKEIKLEEVINNLIFLPSADVLNFFQSLGLLVPRKLRMDVLRKALNPFVADEKLLNELLTDEERYRLRWYDGFSEHQLVNLLAKFRNEQLFSVYREELWLALLGYMFEKGVNENQLTELFEDAKVISKKTTSYPIDSLSFNNDLNPIFFDDPNTIDGLVPTIFRPILYKCSTLVEIREIGLKYDVSVPRRLKKAELLEIIKDELRERNALNAEVENQINNMNVISLQRFAITHDIKASIELKKEEIIEYILKNAKQTTEQYFKPTEFSAYEVAEGFEHLEQPEPVVEEVVPEPVVEEVVEEVVPEPAIEEPVVEEVVEEVAPEPVVEETEEVEQVLTNQINIIFPYVSAVKKKAFKKNFLEVEKEELAKKQQAEDRFKDTVPVRIID